MAKVLILGAAAVQADAVVSAKSHGHEVHVCAAAAGPATPLADANADFSFTELDHLAEYVRAHGIELVYSVGSDIAMPVVGWVGENLGLPYFVGEQFARVCNNKTMMRSALAEHHFVGNPWFARVSTGDPLPDVTGSVMVKPADSQGQRGIARVDDGDIAQAVATAQAASRTETAIVETWLEGPEISVNGYFVDGKPVFSAVSDRHVWPQHVGLVSGHTMPPTTVDGAHAAAASEMALSAARVLGITEGPVYAQVKATTDGPKLVEISPRLDGCHIWQLIRDTYGVDLLDRLWDHLLNDTAPTPLSTTPRGTFGIDFVCAVPGTAAAYDRSDIIRYFEPGDIVRPVNGRFDKIGYRIGPRD
ncbi:ATP-grasp domain-containing protein [Yimella radicis]